jgi:ATP-dependent DNA helicase RecQ
VKIKFVKKLILGYFGEKTTVNCGIYLTVSLTKVRKDDLNLSKEIVALLTIEDLNSREIETN